MKALIASDQHWEFRASKRAEQAVWQVMSAGKDCDLAIIAGDWDLLQRRRWDLFLSMLQICPVIYTAGNHDFYGGSVEEGQQMLAEMENYLQRQTSPERFNLLCSDRVVSIGGRRFLGDTMWMPSRPEVYLTVKQINDPWQIKRLLPWAFEHNERFNAFLERTLEEGDIVVTHHLPSDRSTPAEFRGTSTQPWFVSNMEDIIVRRKPAVWVHGHTHRGCDYQLGQTRILASPLGYPEENGNMRDFRPLVVEL